MILAKNIMVPIISRKFFLQVSCLSVFRNVQRAGVEPAVFGLVYHFIFVSDSISLVWFDTDILTTKLSLRVLSLIGKYR